jgi:hypothetical protein
MSSSEHLKWKQVPATEVIVWVQTSEMETLAESGVAVS